MSEEPRTNVFVYGTLKPGGRYHQTYCGPFQFESRAAWIYGQLFDFPHLGYPGAIEHDDLKIVGCQLDFSHPPEAVLPRLDELEGFDPRRPNQQNEYYRKEVICYDLESPSKSTRAWCYFMEPSMVARLKGLPIPGGKWTI